MAEGGPAGSSGASEQAPVVDGEIADVEETWQLFSNWACCVCVVTFDLELGQALEVHAVG